MKEQIFLEKVRFAVFNLKAHHQPVTYLAVSRSIGIHSLTWSGYSQVRAFVDQNLDSRYLNRSKRQEEREGILLPRVEKAIRQLEALSKPVTFYAVGKLLGVRSVTLKSYPRVSELVEQKGDTSLRRRRTEEEVVTKVYMAIQRLGSRAQSITYQSVAREIGMNPSTLKTYPQVKILLDEHSQSYHIYQRQQFSLREEKLFGQVKTAVAELKALGLPLTQRAICEKIGRNCSILRTYPRVKALIVQSASGYHALQRRSVQPTEDELLQRVEEAVASLVSLGKPITQKSLAQHVKISPRVLMQYPGIVEILKQRGYKKRQRGPERTEKLLGHIQEAINACKANEWPITKKELSRIVGVSCATLRYYPSVRALMTQAAKEDQQQRQEIRFQKREEELAQQVVNAIQQLRDSDKRISNQAVGNIVHLSYTGLHYYPKVRALLESVIAAQPPARKPEQN